jgi:4-oxalocrotonate tautomerase
MKSSHIILLPEINGFSLSATSSFIFLFSIHEVLPKKKMIDGFLRFFSFYEKLNSRINKGGITMPYVTVKMLEGRTDDQKKALVEKVTDAVSETTGAPKENITVFIEEMSKNHYAVAGVRASDK